MERTPRLMGIHQASEQPMWAYILCNNPLSYKMHRFYTTTFGVK